MLATSTVTSTRIFPNFRSSAEVRISDFPTGSDLTPSEKLAFCKYLFRPDPPTGEPKVKAWRLMVEKIAELYQRHQPLDANGLDVVTGERCPLAGAVPMPTVDHSRMGGFLLLWSGQGDCAGAAPVWLQKAVASLMKYDFAGMNGCT